MLRLNLFAFSQKKKRSMMLRLNLFAFSQKKKKRSMMLRLNLFAFSQKKSSVSSEFIVCSRSANVQPEILILLLSANTFTQAMVRQFGRSFMYIKKSKGLGILPCSTPQVNSPTLDDSPLTLYF